MKKPGPVEGNALARTAERSPTLTRRLTNRLEQLLSDPAATSTQVMDGLVSEGLPTEKVPRDRLHRLLIQSLAEAVERNTTEWLYDAVELFLGRAARG